MVISFLRGLGARQRRAFVARMRQPAFAAQVRSVEALAAQARGVGVGAGAGDAALVHAMALRLAMSVAPDEPLLMQLAVHALLHGTDATPPDPADPAEPTSTHGLELQQLREIEPARLRPHRLDD